jgi:hypothetical protein
LTGNDILTITDSGGDGVYVTTGGPHGLLGSEIIDIAGTSVGFYNGTALTVSGALSPTVFILDVAYSGDATGGTWQLSGA